VHKDPGTLRLFFALTPTAAQSAELIERVGPLVEKLRAQRVSPENLHATLCFIGSVAAEKLAQLQDIAAKLRGGRTTLRFDALEHWQKARVLCATAADTSAAPARALASQLASSATAAGFSPDQKPFRPHLTLARKVHPARATACDWPRALTPTFIVDCDRFVLMESRRGESGSIYSVVDSWPLYADDTD